MKNDAEVQLKVIREFKSDPLLAPIASAIRVNASSGIVTISGKVESFLLMNTLEEVALRLKEVEVVSLDIEVTPQSVINSP